MSDGENGLAKINRNEFEQAVAELVENIVEMQDAVNAIRLAVNTQAELIGLHRFVIEKFVPIPHLEAAAKEYHALRQREIATQTAVPGERLSGHDASCVYPKSSLEIPRGYYSNSSAGEVYSSSEVRSQHLGTADV